MGLGIYVGDSQVSAAGRDWVVTSSQGDHFVPCVVEFTDTEVVVGAYNSMFNPKNKIYGLRRMIGKSYDEVMAIPMFQTCPFSIVKNTQNEGFHIEVEIRGVVRQYTAEEILAYVLRHVWELAKDQINDIEPDVVLTVSQDANDKVRQALRDTGSIAGLHVVRIISECTSALLAVPDLRNAPGITHCLVVRLGSYTTDFVYMDCEDGVFETFEIASHDFAGDTLDQLLADHFIRSGMFKDIAIDDRFKFRLKLNCRYLKQALSNNLEEKREFDVREHTFMLEMSRAKFQHLVQSYLDSFLLSLKNFVGTKLIDQLHVIGGSANIPFVLSAIEGVACLPTYSTNIKPSTVICKGAEYQVALLTGYGTYTTTEYIPVPNRYVKGSGLFDYNSTPAEPIPMHRADIRVEIVDILAKVHVTQSFFYTGTSNKEVVYLWPVESQAAVCRFTAKVGDRELEGQVHEKQKAFNMYDEAISASHGAYLMEKVAGDLFQINLGNIVPNTAVSITIEYLTTLKPNGNSKSFTLPTVVPNPYVPTEPTYNINLPNTTALPTAFTLTYVSSAQPTAITSSTHRIQTRAVDGKQFIELCEGELLDKNFDIDFDFAAPLSNVAWVSADPAYGPPAALLSFPATELPPVDFTLQSEYIFLIDRSGSMSDLIEQASVAMLLFIKSLPVNSYFNIVGFGSNFEMLFPQSSPYNETNVGIAVAHLQKLQADLGGTEILPPLKKVLSDRSIAHTKKIILVTDGAVSNTDELIAFVKAGKKDAQIFTLGIGYGCSKHLVTELAKEGDGTHSFVNSKEAIGQKVIGLLKSSYLPAVKTIEVEYTTADGRTAKAPLQSSFYFLDTRLCYVHLDPSHYPPTNFKLTAILFGGKKGSSFTVNVQNKNFTGDNVIQLMAANAKVRELEVAGNTNTAELLEICTKFNLASRITSYVVVEKRTDAVQETMEQEVTMRESGKSLYTKKTVTKRASAVQDLLLLDVTPLDVGFYDEATSTHVVLIPRNSTIPCKKSTVHTYTVQGDNPEIKIYEQQNHLLATVKVPTPTPLPSTLQLETTFEIDANGILVITVADLASQNFEQATISNDAGRLSKDEIEKLLNSVNNANVVVANSHNSTFTVPVVTETYTPANDQMVQFVQLQKLDGTWVLDEAFAKLFATPDAVSSHQNVTGVRALLPANASEDLVGKLWATSLALAFFHSDAMLAKKDEWELLVDKSMFSLSTLIASDKLEHLLKLGKEALADLELVTAVQAPTLTNTSLATHTSGMPTIDEVD